jgi:hypothetical protein
MSDETVPGATQGAAQSVQVTYEKSPAFRTIHVDGVFGGSTPRGMIQMAMFNERSPIPQTTEHRLIDGSLFGAEIMSRRVGKQGLFREIEVNAVLDLDSAKIVHSWLAEHIARLEAALAANPNVGRVSDAEEPGDEH